MRIFVLLCFISMVLSHAIVEIDNGIIGEPEVQCESDSISLLFHSKNPFVGKIFVKGFVADPDCVSMGNNKNSHRFTVKHNSCGVRRQREVNGVVIVSTVIVSFHSIFITKIDRAYRLSCFYVEATKKVQQQLDVAMLTTQALESQTQLPVCRYEILSDDPNGIPIKYAKIGDTVYHKWTCISELTDVYCMRVHSCTVYDGQGGPPVTVLDANGCSIDGVILQNLNYLSDLTAGKPAQVFKFADKAGLYFNCQIQLTIKDKQYGCSTSQPQCVQTYVESAAQTTEVSSEYTGSHESGYPTKSVEEYPTSKTQEYPTSTEDPSYATSVESSREYPQPYPIYVRTGKNRLIVNMSSTGHGPSAVSGPPGSQPTYYDLHANDTEYVTSTISSFNGPNNAYTRLIKRNIQSAVFHNRSQPITVADFDLPERGLIVFGLDDGNGEDSSSNENTARLVFDDRKTCFTTNKLLTFFVLCVLLLTSLIFSLGLIVYKQRRMISQSFFKH